MYNVHIILIIILVSSLIFNYLSFSSKKTAVQFVNDMGIGYNLGNTFNCCNIIEEKNSENEEIKLFGTTLPIKNIIKKIKKMDLRLSVFRYCIQTILIIMVKLILNGYIKSRN